LKLTGGEDVVELLPALRA